MENDYGRNYETEAAPRRSRGRPQVRSDEETRALILEAAGQEFQANGYEATCIADVAERAGVSTKTLYRLIPTKADLFANVVADRIGRFVLEYDLSRLDSLDATAALERMLTVFGTLTLDPRTIALTRLVLGECCAFPEVGADVLRNAIARTSQAMEDGLRRLCARGLIALDDPHEAVGMLRGMMIMEPQRAAMLGQREPPERGRRSPPAPNIARGFSSTAAQVAGRADLARVKANVQTFGASAIRKAALIPLSGIRSESALSGATRANWTGLIDVKPSRGASVATASQPSLRLFSAQWPRSRRVVRGSRRSA